MFYVQTNHLVYGLSTSTTKHRSAHAAGLAFNKARRYLRKQKEGSGTVTLVYETPDALHKCYTLYIYDMEKNETYHTEHATALLQ